MNPIPYVTLRDFARDLLGGSPAQGSTVDGLALAAVAELAVDYYGPGYKEPTEEHLLVLKYFLRHPEAEYHDIAEAGFHWKQETVRAAERFWTSHREGGPDGSIGMLAKWFWHTDEAFLQCNEQHTVLRAIGWNGEPDLEARPYVISAWHMVLDAHQIKLDVEQAWLERAKQGTPRNGLIKDWPGSNDYR